MNCATPLPTSGFFAASLLLHALVLWKFSPPPLSLPTAALQPLEITLLSTPGPAPRTPPAAAPRTVSREPPPSHSPAAAATSETPAATATQRERVQDHVQVAARFDAASLDNPRPVYPLAARRRGLQGSALLMAHIRADGGCSEVRLARSSGHALLDTAAISAVRQWRFLPARRGATPVDSWVTIPITFRLQENG